MPYAVLPKGVSASDFRRALAEFAGVVGQDHVIAEQERLTPYRKIQIPIEEDRVAPSGVVMPASVDEIRKLLAIANRYKVPLWTISTGRNFGYGSAAPATRGQVVLDLRRMNKIIHVDPDLCTALVEPGVTYGQLQAYIDEHDLPVCLDMPGGGPITGPVGNSLERGVGYTPYGDHWSNVCGLEVMLADGELVRTGMGSLAGSNTWQSFKYGYGPYLDGMFSQSNFGIVTKLGFWVMPRPAGTRTYRAAFWGQDDLAQIVETVRPLKIGNVIANVATIANAGMILSTRTSRAKISNRSGRIPISDVYAYAKTLGIAPWNLSMSFYGTEDQMRAAEQIALPAVKATGGEVTLTTTASVSQIGRAGMEAYNQYNWVGGGGSIWFTPVAPTFGADAAKQYAMADRLLTEFDFDYVGAFIVMGRDMHHVLDLFYDRSDPEAMKRAYACYDKMLDVFTKEGYGLYRVATAFMDKVAGIYGPERTQLHRRLKQALDPNGILSPGKSGIYT